VRERVLSRLSRSFGFDKKIEKKFLEHRSGKIYFCLCNEISTPQFTHCNTRLVTQTYTALYFLFIAHSSAPFTATTKHGSLNLAKKWTLLFCSFSSFFPFLFFFLMQFFFFFFLLLLTPNEIHEHFTLLPQINHGHLPVISELHIERFHFFASIALLLLLSKVRLKR